MSLNAISSAAGSRLLLKVLDGAFLRDPAKAFEAATELAAALEAQGATGAAGRIRKRLERVPQSTLKASQPGRTMNPISGDGGRQMLDEERPSPGVRDRLVLADPISRQLDEFLAEIRAHDALAEAGVADPARLLLEGPPGVGKTSIARVVASELAVPLLTVRCDGAIGSLLGSTGANLRKVLDHASSTPCVLLLDEFDALARARVGGDGRDVGEMNRVVISLLQGLDALPDETVVIAATNHAHLLDPAVWRRFPRKIRLALPGMRERSALWERALGKYLTVEHGAGSLAQTSEGMSHADIAAEARKAIRAAILAGESEVSVPRLKETISRLTSAPRGTQRDSDPAFG